MMRRFYYGLAAAAALTTAPASAATWVLNFSGVTRELIQFYGYTCTDSTDCYVMGNLPSQPVTIAGGFLQESLNPGESRRFFYEPFGSAWVGSSPSYPWDPRTSRFSGILNYDGHKLWATDVDFTYSTDSSIGDACQYGSGMICHLITGKLPTASITFLRAEDGAPPVPEPATWLSLILGLGITAATLRARRRQPHPA